VHLQSIVLDLRLSDYISSEEETNLKFQTCHLLRNRPYNLKPLVLPVCFFAGKIQQSLDHGTIDSLGSNVRPHAPFLSDCVPANARGAIRPAIPQSSFRTTLGSGPVMWLQVLMDAYKLLLVTLCQLSFIDESDYVTFSALELEGAPQNYYHTQVCRMPSWAQATKLMALLIALLAFAPGWSTHALSHASSGHDAWARVWVRGGGRGTTPRLRKLQLRPIWTRSAM
jgi:hypothetical protein